MIPWWRRQSDVDKPWIILWIWAVMLLAALVPVLLGWFGY